MADVFTSELAFEDALVGVPECDYGWKNGMLIRPRQCAKNELCSRNSTDD